MTKSSSSRVEVIRHTSAVLAGNAAGDPHERDVVVYLPAGHDDAQRRYAVIYFLAGFTGTGRMMLNYDPWVESIDARLDRLIASGAMPPVICVLPDCFTRYGGSQYLNSSATGRYEDYIVDELVPLVDGRFKTVPSRDARGVVGKSSGGYGALRLAMRRPETFGALGSHAGDAYFAYCYLPDFPKFVMDVERHGGVENFVAAFAALPKKTKEALEVMNILAMAAAYSPDPDAPLGIDLPMTLPSGEIRPDVWQRWVENDPVHMVPQHADALRSMRAIFLDAGKRDEWNLHLGARMLCRKFDAVGARYIHEEFDDGHLGINYRYDRSFVELGKALTT